MKREIIVLQSLLTNFGKGTASASGWLDLVLVYLPNEDAQSPEFYILTGEELHGIPKPRDEASRKNYREKHGWPFDGRGVVSVTRTEVEVHKAKWRKVVSTLHDTDAAT